MTPDIPQQMREGHVGERAGGGLGGERAHLLTQVFTPPERCRAAADNSGRPTTQVTVRERDYSLWAMKS